MGKRWLIGGVVVVVVLAAAAGGLWMTQRGPLAGGSAQAAKLPGAGASAPLAFRANEVIQPTLAQLSELIEFSGPLVAPNTAMLRAKASGTLLTLDVAEGLRVRAGQALGRIDMAELGSRIAERNANLESARATVLQAERSHAGNERLAAQNFISGTALDNSRGTREGAPARVLASGVPAIALPVAALAAASAATAKP